MIGASHLLGHCLALINADHIPEMNGRTGGGEPAPNGCADVAGAARHNCYRTAQIRPHAPLTSVVLALRTIDSVAWSYRIDHIGSEAMATVRVMQERWGVFLNLPAAVQRFTRDTGIEVEVHLLELQEMWDGMHAAFEEDDPPFDLVGVDELLLVAAARRHRVHALDEHIVSDGYPMDDFLPATVGVSSDDGRVLGLPYAAVSNVLIYREDLLEEHGFSVPQTMEQLLDVAAGIRSSAVARGDHDLFGLALRGEPGCGLNYWSYGSTWAPSWGARNYDSAGRALVDTPEHVAALEHYLEVQRRGAPPGAESMGFIGAMQAYREGRVAMVIEPANEASMVFDDGGAIAKRTRTAVVPAGPLGTRHPGLYCPPYAIPERSRHKAEAWELAKYLCAHDQMIEDAVRAGFVEVARDSAFADHRFIERFQPELLQTVRETRKLACGERPVTDLGMAVGDAVGEGIGRALRGEASAASVLSTAAGEASGTSSP